MTDVWTMQSREDEIAFCQAHGINLPFDAKHSYSRDRNLWHISHEGLELEDPANEPNYEHILQMSVTPEKAPDQPEYVTLDFEKGIPVAVNGEKLNPVALLTKLNEIGGRNGVGITDICENRVVGMKSRGVYENPAGAIIYYGHNDLENLCLDRATQSFKQQVSIRYSELVYDGMWFSPLREALDAFANSLAKTVTGDVKLKLYKGNMINAGVTSPFTLYDEQTASFGEDEDYNQADAAGFINLFGLSIKERAKLSKNWPEVK